MSYSLQYDVLSTERDRFAGTKEGNSEQIVHIDR